MDKIEKICAEIERRLKDYWEICFHDVKAYNEDSNVRELKELLSFLDTLSEEPGVDVTDFCKPIDPGIAQCVADHWHEMFGEVDKCPKNTLPPSKECDHGLREPLESEEPDKSLEEEIKRYIPRDQCPVPDFMEAVARHFAEWGAKHLRDTTKMIDKSLEEAAENYIAPIENDEGLDYINLNGRDIKDAFIAGAEWQKEQDDKETADLLTIAHLQGMEQMKGQLLQGSPMPEDTVLFNKGVAEGKRLMMEDAVEGEIVKDITNKLAVTAKAINLDGFKFGQKVRIVVLKAEEE